MTTENFAITITVDANAADVYKAINNVRGWWSEEIDGITDQLNAEWDYHYQDVHKCKMKVIELVPNQKVIWLVVDNHFSFTKDKSEWIGNRIVFDIQSLKGKTKVTFTQEGLVSEYECYDICQNAWRTYVEKSLLSLILTGKGQPNGKDKPQTKDEMNLGDKDFTTTFFVDQKPEQVFNAINNVRGWWQGEVEGSTTKLHDEFIYRMQDIHYSKQRIVELISNEKVVWMVTESKLNFVSDKMEWTGTKIIFEIKEINNKTQVRFTHQGLVPEFQCYNDCSNAWSLLIQESLYSLITTGKGKKVF